jgi:hypothetical protein
VTNRGKKDTSLMKTIRFITAMTITIATLAAPVWAQDTTTTPASPQTPAGSTVQSGSMAGTGSGMSGDDYYNRMSSADKYRYSWVFNNLDQREVRRFRSQGFTDADIKGAAHIAMASGLSVPYVLSRYRESGLPLADVAFEVGAARTDLGADIPGYGMSASEMSLAMFGGGMGMPSSGTTSSSTYGTTSTGTTSTGTSPGGATGTGTGTTTTPAPTTPAPTTPEPTTPAPTTPAP